MGNDRMRPKHIFASIRPGQWFNDKTVRRVYANASLLFSGKVIAGLLSLVYVSLAAHALGPTHFGVLVLVNAYTLSIASVFTFHGRYALVRYATLCLAEESPGKLHKLFSFILLIELGFGALAISLAIFFAPYAAEQFSWPKESLPTIVFYSLACVSMMHSMPAGVLYVYRRFHLLSLQQTVGPLVRLIAAAIAYVLHAGLDGFLLAWLAGAIAEAATQWFFGLRELARRGMLRGLLVWPKGIVRQHDGIWRFILANKLDISLEELNSRAIPLAVGWMLGPAAAGLYHVALRIGMVLAQPVLVIGQTLYPELSQLAAENQMRMLVRVVLRTGMIATTMGLAVLLILALSGDKILELMGGTGFDAAYGVLLLIAFARTLHLFGFPLASALVACGKPGTVLMVNLMATLLLLPVLLGLLHAYRLNGAGLHAVAFALATVISMAVIFRRHAINPAAPGQADR